MNEALNNILKQKKTHSMRASRSSESNGRSEFADSLD